MTEITDAELDEWERLRAEVPLLKVSRLIKDLRACRQRNEKNEERILRLRHLNTRYRQRANALEAAPETAAERDRLKSANEHWHTRVTALKADVDVSLAERDRLKATNAKLLAALEAACDLLGDFGQEDTNNWPVFQQIVAAIAEAQGDQ